MQTWNIVYTGIGLAGCQTSVSVIARDCDPNPGAERLRSSPCDVRWSNAEGTHRLRLMHEYNSNLYVPRLIDALHEKPPDPADTSNFNWVSHWNRLVPGWRALATFLETIHGVVFVVDSSAERIEAGLERLEHLTRNLRDCGRDPSEIVLVFQLNKRDVPSAEHVDVLRDLFRWPGRSAFVESVAPRAIGVRDALNAAIQLLAHQ